MKKLFTLFTLTTKRLRRIERRKLVTSSCIVIGSSSLAAAYYLGWPDSSFSWFGCNGLLAAETAVSLNSDISDETDRRRKCSQLVKQFKVGDNKNSH